MALTSVRGEIEFVAKTFPALHPGQSAAILLNGKEIGFIGTVHPKIVQKLGLSGKPVVFEILAEAIAERSIPNAKEISRFPANKRDIAVVVDVQTPAGDVLATCRQAGGEKLLEVSLFDVYQGANLAQDKKSLAISLTIQDMDKTLEEDEINGVIQNVLNALEQRFNAYLRD